MDDICPLSTRGLLSLILKHIVCILFLWQPIGSFPVSFLIKLLFDLFAAFCQMVSHSNNYTQVMGLPSGVERAWSL